MTTVTRTVAILPQPDNALEAMEKGVRVRIVVAILPQPDNALEFQDRRWQPPTHNVAILPQPDNALESRRTGSYQLP